AGTWLEYGDGGCVCGIEGDKTLRISRCQPADCNRQSECGLRKLETPAVFGLPAVLVLMQQLDVSLPADESGKALFARFEFPDGVYVRPSDRRAVDGLAELS